jgi:adenine-specific DNA methylase
MNLKTLLNTIAAFKANTPAKRALLTRATEAFWAMQAAKQPASSTAYLNARSAFLQAVEAIQQADQFELVSDADFMVALVSLNRTTLVSLNRPA